MEKDNVIDLIDGMNNEKVDREWDRISKLLASDYYYISWIAWCLDIFFKEFTYSQMFDYIGSVDEEELKNVILEVSTLIDAEKNFGVLFDKHYLYYSDKKPIALLGIENQLHAYPLGEIEARSIVYICSDIFWERGPRIKQLNNERIIKKDHYRDMIAPVALWIFPEGPNYLDNHVNIIEIPLPESIKQINFIDNSAQFIKPKFQTKSVIYQVYTGDPDKIDNALLSQEDKKAYLNLLLDLVNDFDIEKQKRKQLLLKFFNLKGSKVDSEVEVMGTLSAWMASQKNIYINEGKAEGIIQGRSEGIVQGRSEGIVQGKSEGIAEEKEKNLKALTESLIKRSNGKLSKEEALSEAKSLLMIN